jgi:hypothetical protein
MYRSIDSSRIRNLKLISRLKTGDKLCTRYHHYSIDAYSPLSYRALFRMIHGESRSETIDSLTQLTESCVNQYGIAPDERTRLADEFKDVVKGIKNLSLTYKDDSTACVGLDLIREMMEEYIGLFATPCQYFANGDQSILTRSPQRPSTPHPIVDEEVMVENVDLVVDEVEA